MLRDITRRGKLSGFSLANSFNPIEILFLVSLDKIRLPLLYDVEHELEQNLLFLFSNGNGFEQLVHLLGFSEYSLHLNSCLLKFIFNMALQY